MKFPGEENGKFQQAGEIWLYRHHGAPPPQFRPVTSSLAPRSRGAAGFTLMELMVVIAILSIAVAVVLPKLPSTEANRLQYSARSLAAAIRFIGDRAATTKTGYRMHLKLSDSTIWVRKLSATGEEIAVDESFLGRRLIADGITIEDIIIPQTGKLSEGEVIIGFGSGGLQDFMIIHLKDSKPRHFTVTAFPNNGKVKVEQGYRESQQ